jgi:hypothetical protein
MMCLVVTGDTRYEYLLLLEAYICWRCLLTLSTKVQMLFAGSEATLHHQGLAVYSVLGGRLHVVEIAVAGGMLALSLVTGDDCGQGVSVQCGSCSATCRLQSHFQGSNVPNKPGGGGNVRGRPCIEYLLALQIVTVGVVSVVYVGRYCAIAFSHQQPRDGTINLTYCLEDPRMSKVTYSVYLGEEARVMLANR